MKVEVFVPWVGPSTNKVWAGIHWAKRKKIADEGHFACLVVKGLKLPWGKVNLEFIPHIPKGRLYDSSNYSVSAKVIEDGLVECGVLKGDSVKHVAGVLLSPPVRGKDRGTLIRFTDASPEESLERMAY